MTSELKQSELQVGLDSEALIRGPHEAAGPLTLLQVIANAATDPRVDPDKLERLLGIQERIMAHEAEVAWKRDMAGLQSDLPVILKTAKGHNFFYAPLEDIDRAVQPLLTRYGFSVSYDSEPTGKDVVWKCIVSHRDGHERIFSAPPLPADASGSKNPVQAIFSAGSYGQRYAFCAAFKIVPRGMDDSGAATSFLSEEQEMKLLDMLNEAEIRKGSDRYKKFLAYAEADAVSHIQQFKFDSCAAMLRKVISQKGGAA